MEDSENKAISDNPYGDYCCQNDAEYAYYERMNDFPPSEFEVNRERYYAEYEDMKREGLSFDDSFGNEDYDFGEEPEPFVYVAPEGLTDDDIPF